MVLSDVQIRTPAPIGPGYRSPRPLCRALQAAFVAWTVLGGLIFAANVVQYRLVTRVLDNPLAVSLGELQASDDRRAMLGGLALYLGLATAATVVVWTSRMYANLPPLGIEQLRFAPGWAVGGWLVPLLNLWRPKQIVDDIWRASDPALPHPAGSEWRGRPVAAVLHWWWASFVVGTVGGFAATVAVGAEIESRVEAALLLAPSVVALAGAVLAFWVVTRLTNRQETRAAALAAPARVPAPGPAEPQDDGSRRRSWVRSAALPVLAAVVAAAGFLAWDEPGEFEVITAEPSDDGTTVYDRHGVRFTLPAHEWAVEGAWAAEEGAGDAADVSDGVAEVEFGDVYLAVAWTAVTYQPTTRDLRAELQNSLSPVEATGGPVATTRQGEPFIYRSFRTEEDGTPLRGVVGWTTCAQSDRLVMLLAISETTDALDEFDELAMSLRC